MFDVFNFNMFFEIVIFLVVVVFDYYMNLFFVLCKLCKVK